MNITIIAQGTVKYNGHYLEQYVTYNDIDEATAEELINLKEAKQVGDNVPAVSYTIAPQSETTPKFDAKKNGGYVAEAVIDPAKRAKLEAEGKLSDETPVTGKDNTLPKDTTPEPTLQTEVEDESGKKLTEDELRAKENAAVAAAGKEANETTPTIGELQNAGQEVSR